ncbi:MAG: hypothetical protein K2N01_06355 [Lachnospiraceae bacterium]|nr:hypothetical protein [Lachnospiraceae bacterium]
MIEKLSQLYKILVNNEYYQDAERIKELMNEIAEGATDTTEKRLIAMCNPRYLGNLNIKEYESVYEWWNFLGSISELASKEIR